MSKLKLQALAKINLGLSVTGKRPDGYHSLETIFCQISLYDDILIEEIAEDTIFVDVNSIFVPSDQRNTAYKAAMILKNLYDIKRGVRITIDKKIPVEAGLGGGSSDGASVLLGLNSLWKLNLSNQRLIDIALKIGADVPYFILGKTQFAKGVGEILTELPPFSKKKLIVCVPKKRVNTKQAFEFIDSKRPVTERQKMELLLRALREKNLNKISRLLFNDFENVVLGKIPDINYIKKTMIKNGALGTVLTGSGSGVFGIFDNEKKRKQTFRILKNDYNNTFMAETL